MTQIELESNGDKVISTSGSFHKSAPSSNVELISEPQTRHRPLIELTEPKNTTKYDSDSDGECGWFANPSKIAPKKPASLPDVDVHVPGNPVQTDETPSFPPVPEPLPQEEEKNDTFPPYESRRPFESIPDPVNIASSFLQGSGVFSMSEDGIRRQKSHLLHQYSLKNKDRKYSSKVLTMDCDINEIKDELQFVDTQKDMEGSLSLWKTGLVIFSDGLVQINKKVDPFGVDMSEWSQRMWFDVMQKGSYDEVLLELVEKYKGSVPVGPELKLLVMMGMSFGGTLVTKKREQAQLEKLRKEQEKRINEEVEARVREQLAKQQPNPTGPRRYDPQPRATARSPSPVQLQGPTFTADEINKLMTSDFIDSVDEPSEDHRAPTEPTESSTPHRGAPSPQSCSESSEAESIRAPPRKTVRKPAAPRGGRRGGRGRGNDLIVNLDRD